MPVGIQIFGPAGQIWFDTNDMTTRVMGRYDITSPSVGLPNMGPPNYSYYLDFNCPATVTPWMYQIGQSNCAAGGTCTRLNSTTARILFNLSYPQTGWPSGAKIVIYYGYGR